MNYPMSLQKKFVASRHQSIKLYSRSGWPLSDGESVLSLGGPRRLVRLPAIDLIAYGFHRVEDLQEASGPMVGRDALGKRLQ